MTITTQQLVQSLKSKKCPACAGGKASRNTFCGSCYSQLQSLLKRSLYNPIGAGYEEAVHEAFIYLEVETPHLPE